MQATWCLQWESIGSADTWSRAYVIPYKWWQLCVVWPWFGKVIISLLNILFYYASYNYNVCASVNGAQLIPLRLKFCVLMLFGYHNFLELWFSLIIFLHDFISDAPIFLMYLRFVTTLMWKAVDRAQSPGDLGLSEIPGDLGLSQSLSWH